jgi:hypothetical protein
VLTLAILENLEKKRAYARNWAGTSSNFAGHALGRRATGMAGTLTLLRDDQEPLATIDEAK